LDAGFGKALVAGPLLPPEPGPEDSVLHLHISDTYIWLFSGHHYCSCGSLQSANAYRPEVPYGPQPVHGVYQHHYGLLDPVPTDTDAARFAVTVEAKDTARFRLRAWLRVSTVGSACHTVFANGETVSLSSLLFASSTSTA
jgi:hypothetical protein